MAVRPFHCLELLTDLETLREPAEWADAAARIASERDRMEAFVAQYPEKRFYGINTFPGHMDKQTLDATQLQAFQHYLIDNHTIGGETPYGERAVRAIGYAKLTQAALGGSGLSPTLFAHMRRAVTARDFTPFVPKDSSYSCGDVIPAAHWAGALIRFRDYAVQSPLGPKEGMSLINGSFVHAGLALSGLRGMKRAWDALLFTTRLGHALSQANPSNLHVATTDAGDPYARAAALLLHASAQKPIQDPVSVRAAPQMLGTLGASLQGFCRTLDLTFARQSDNPLFDAQASALHSQASFLDPLLTLATGQLTEAWLFCLWTAERRLHYLLSGECSGIPINGADESDYLGFIQAPKRASALLEQIRLTAGRRLFASGSSTSYGIEDLWSNGLLALDQWDTACARGVELLHVEASVMLGLVQRYRPDLLAQPLLASFGGAPDDFRARVAFCRDHMTAQSDEDEWRWPFALS